MSATTVSKPSHARPAPKARGWDVLLQDLCDLIAPHISGAPEQALLDAYLASAEDGLPPHPTERVTIHHLLGGDLLWGAAEVMGYGDTEESVTRVTRALLEQAAARLGMDVLYLRRRLWSGVMARVTARAVPPRPDRPAHTAWDIADAWGELRLDLRQVAQARASITEAEEKAASATVYRANGKCKSCFAPVHWRMTDAGRPSPHNLDGTSHFSTCPHAARHRRPY